MNSKYAQFHLNSSSTIAHSRHHHLEYLFSGDNRNRGIAVSQSLTSPMHPSIHSSIHPSMFSASHPIAYHTYMYVHTLSGIPRSRLRCIGISHRKLDIGGFPTLTVCRLPSFLLPLSSHLFPPHLSIFPEHV